MAGKNKNYISWDEYFMTMAFLSSLRSKDPSNQVGACIVKDNRILACGYNGATLGFSDDDFPWDSLGEETADILNIKNTFTVHAEQNAIDNFRGNKREMEGSTLYITWFPCNECAKRIIQNDIKEVVYARMYSDLKTVEAAKIMFEKKGVLLRQFGNINTKEDTLKYQKRMFDLIKSFSK